MTHQTDLQRLQSKKIEDAERMVSILFGAALRRWRNLQSSLRLRKLRALESLLSRDIEQKPKK